MSNTLLPQPPSTGAPSSHARPQRSTSASGDPTPPPQPAPTPSAVGHAAAGAGRATYTNVYAAKAPPSPSCTTVSHPSPSAPAVAVGGWRAAYSSYVTKPLRPQRQPCAPQHEQPINRSRGPVASPSVPPPSAHAPDAADAYPINRSRSPVVSTSGASPNAVASAAVVEGTPPTEVEPCAAQPATPVTTSTAPPRSCGASVIVPDVWGRVMEFLHVADWFFLANVCVCLDGVVVDVARERRVSCATLHYLRSVIRCAAAIHTHTTPAYQYIHGFTASMERCAAEQLVFQVRHGVQRMGRVAVPTNHVWGLLSLATKREVVARCASNCSAATVMWFDGVFATREELARLECCDPTDVAVVRDFHKVKRTDAVQRGQLPCDGDSGYCEMAFSPSAQSNVIWVRNFSLGPETRDDWVPSVRVGDKPFLDFRQLMLRRQNHRITDAFLHRVAAHSTHLTILRLSGMLTLSDAGVAAVCEACPLLKEFSIANTGGTLGDRSLFALAANARDLEVLDVSSCCGAVTDAGLNAIAMSCHRLQGVHVRDSPPCVTDEPLSKMVRFCPGVEIIDASKCRGVVGTFLQLAIDLVQRGVRRPLRRVELIGVEFNEPMTDWGHCYREQNLMDVLDGTLRLQRRLSLGGRF